MATSQSKKSANIKSGSKRTSQKATDAEILLFWHTATNKLEELPGVSCQHMNIEERGKMLAVLVSDGVQWDDAGNPVFNAGN